MGKIGRPLKELTTEEQKRIWHDHYLVKREKRRKQERKEGEARGENVEWDEFKEHVRIEALKGDAPAAIMGIYRDLLKLSLPQSSNGINPDEMVRRNLEAERQLEEWYRGRDEVS